MSASTPLLRRRRFAPEVVQTSAMDCGPAALTCLLQGHGQSVSYGRLREACQTDVDGTSVDTLEEIAVQLGLAAEQILVPVDHVLLPEAMAFPAIVVVQQPNGALHFVVAWRCHRRVVQVMDPGTGRRWPTWHRFLDELYVHTQTIPVAAWRAWAETDECLGALRRRWTMLGIGGTAVAPLLHTALEDADWFPLATLDATTRMLAAMVHSGGVRRGRHATQVFALCYARACEEGPLQTHTVPASYWTVRPAPHAVDGLPALQMRGAVLVRVRAGLASSTVRGRADAVRSQPAAPELPPDLAAALEEPPSRPGRQLLSLLSADGLLTPSLLGLSVAVAASSTMVEALLWRGLVDLHRDLGAVHQRLGALLALLVFLGALLGLDLGHAMALGRLGRRLEARLRLALCAKIPRLGDRYFHSRPLSDMAARSHSVHRLRLLPGLGGQIIHLAAELVVTTAGLVWLAPAQAPLAVLAACCMLGLPFAVHALLSERDLRVQTHAGALGSVMLEALLGLTAVRTHRAERAMHHAHESLLAEWTRAGLHLQRAVVHMEGLQSLLGFGCAAGLLWAYLAREGAGSGVLLLAYWALRLPGLGQELLVLLRQYPGQRNVTLRLLEPLGAPEEGGAARAYAAPWEPDAAAGQGVAIALEGVSVQAAGHTILTDLSLTLAPGSHVAIVGPSGAGKSSLVGLLLGWHRPATGRVLVDGRPLDGPHLAWLRQVTAWVDPSVQLWNRSLLDNLTYGTTGSAVAQAAQAMAQADVQSVLDHLPDGLQTRLGEGGGLVSGGEGQRLRLGRALTRPGVRLVILDEAFRGLDRTQRRTLLQRARQVWGSATLLCITHDVDVTQDFSRVLVVEDGRLVEDGAPATLAACAGTRYRALLDAEGAVHECLWASGLWRRLRLVAGRVCPEEG